MQIERQIAREQLVRALCEGRTFQEVSTESSVPLKRAMAYRLLRAVRTKGNIALQDGRHGHPSKLREEARAFLEACCRKTPCTPSPTLQTALRERFDLYVSVSQINGSVRTENAKMSKTHQCFSNAMSKTMKQRPSVLAKLQVAHGRTVVVALAILFPLLCGESGNTGVIRHMHNRSEPLIQRSQSHASESLVV